MYKRIKSRHQAKNNNDSYKLLKGKYPEINQRRPRIIKRRIFEEKRPIQHKFFKIGSLGYRIDNQ